MKDNFTFWKILIIGALLLSAGGFLFSAYVSNQNAGASLDIPTPVALFETSLASNISSTATSMTLTSATDKTGTALASSTYAFIIDEGTASEEMVLADCTGTACTNMVRGISVLTGTTSVSALKFSHRRGASVKITDGPQLLILSRIINGVGSFPNLVSYSSGTACDGSSANGVLCNKLYIDSVAGAGGATSTESNGGFVELGTALEAASSTDGGADKPLVLQTKNATSSPGYSCDASGVAGALCVLVADNAGKIKQAWLDLTADFTWTGNQTYNGNGTATSTFNRGVDIDADADTPLILRALSYIFPSAHSVGWLYNDGSGTLDWTAPTAQRYTFATSTDTTTVSVSCSNCGNNSSSATSTPASFTIPTGTLTASSTIEVRANGVCDMGSIAGTASASCQFALRVYDGSAWTTLWTESIGSDATGDNLDAALAIGVTTIGNNSSSAQVSTGMCSMDEDAVTGISGCNGLVNTTSIDFTQPLSFAFVITASASATGGDTSAVDNVDITSYSIVVNP